MSEEWFRLLRAGRKKGGISREEVARASSLSVDTVHSYELGRRGPHRETLEAMVSALSLDRRDSQAILRAAGFAVERSIAPVDLKKLQESSECMPWPQLITTEDMHILYVNTLMTKLSGRDVQQALPEIECNSFVVMAHRLPLSHLANWDEQLAFSIARWKRDVGPEIPLDRPWISSLTHRLAKLGKLNRFFELWDRTPAYPQGTRPDMPLVGHYPRFGDMRFRVVISSVIGCPDVVVTDMIPADTNAWRALEMIREL